ncbi:MAG: translation initiation factor IF-5A [archaeon]|jgi:translation initiation factor 5A|nr:translation initiation factor IF-5A [archaeon]
MSQTEIREIRTLKVGRYIVIDNEPCKLVEYITSKPGKHGEAKARMVAIGLFDGQKRSLVHPVKHKVHVPLVDRRKAQILANMGAEIQMMDLETFETFNVPLKDIPEKFHVNMEPGNEIVFLSAMGRKLVTD